MADRKRTGTYFYLPETCLSFVRQTWQMPFKGRCEYILVRYVIRIPADGIPERHLPKICLVATGVWATCFRMPGSQDGGPQAYRDVFTAFLKQVAYTP